MSEDQSVARARVASKPLQRLVPGLLLRTLLKPDDIARQVLVGLRDDAPGGAILSAEIPHVDLYFQITNLSPVDLILDRMLVDVWFGQPTFSVTMLHRYPVPAGEVTHGLHVRQMLAENQRTQVETFSAQAGQGNRLHIYITAYFESKLGRFFIQRSIERSGL